MVRGWNEPECRAKDPRQLPNLGGLVSTRRTCKQAAPLVSGTAHPAQTDALEIEANAAPPKSMPPLGEGEDFSKRGARARAGRRDH
jgi:hypothetical protein